MIVALALLAAAAPAAAQSDPDDDELARASGGRTIAIGSPAAGHRVASIPLELYVARVLAGEAEPRAADAAMQAMAIAVRTYAIFNTRRHAKDGYDLCDTTHCQVLRAATPATRRAALATAGRVLTYHDAVAEIFYSASCGGRSEDAAEVWPRSRLPYLRSVVDDVHEEDEPWVLELSFAEIQRRLRAEGFTGRLREIRIDSRNRSGRVSQLRLRGLTPDRIGGAEFRMAMGPTEVKSTAFTMMARREGVRLTGRGYGHGVGMCTVGAGRRARRGETAEEILRVYFPGLELAPLPLKQP